MRKVKSLSGKPEIFTSVPHIVANQSYTLCQTGYNAIVLTCYAAAVFIVGAATAGVGVPAASGTGNILAINNHTVIQNL